VTEATDAKDTRMMLRGFFNWPVFDGRFFAYNDVAPFIKKIVDKAYDMYLMPPIPKANGKFGNIKMICKQHDIY